MAVPGPVGCGRGAEGPGRRFGTAVMNPRQKMSSLNVVVLVSQDAREGCETRSKCCPGLPPGSVEVAERRRDQVPCLLAGHGDASQVGEVAGVHGDLAGLCHRSARLRPVPRSTSSSSNMTKPSRGGPCGDRRRCGMTPSHTAGGAPPRAGATTAGAGLRLAVAGSRRLFLDHEHEPVPGLGENLPPVIRSATASLDVVPADPCRSRAS